MDWVVLTAAAVGLGIASVGAINTGVGSVGTSVEGSLSSATVASLGTLGAGDAASSGGSSYALKFKSQTGVNFDIAYFANMSEQDVISFMQAAANLVLLYNAEGYRSGAGQYLDEYYAASVAASQRNLTLPDNMPTLQQLDADYTAAFG